MFETEVKHPLTTSTTCAALGTKFFAVATRDRRIHIKGVNRRSRDFERRITSEIGVNSLKFGANETTLAYGTLNGNIKIWSLLDDKVLYRLSKHKSSVNAIVVEPRSQALWASGSFDGSVFVWDLRSSVQKSDGSLTPSIKFEDQTKQITCLQFSPDGKFLAASCDDCRVQIYDIRNKKCLTELAGHSQSISKVAFHPLDLLLATGSRDKTIRFWDFESYECVSQSGPAPSGPILDICFDSTGTRLFSLASEQTTSTNVPKYSGGEIRICGWEPYRLHNSLTLPSSLRPLALSTCQSFSLEMEATPPACEDDDTILVLALASYQEESAFQGVSVSRAHVGKFREPSSTEIRSKTEIEIQSPEEIPCVLGIGEDRKEDKASATSPTVSEGRQRRRRNHSATSTTTSSGGKSEEEKSSDKPPGTVKKNSIDQSTLTKKSSLTTTRSDQHASRKPLVPAALGKNPVGKKSGGGATASSGTPVQKKISKEPNPHKTPDSIVYTLPTEVIDPFVARPKLNRSPTRKDDETSTDDTNGSVPIVVVTQNTPSPAADIMTCSRDSLSLGETFVINKVSQPIGKPPLPVTTKTSARTTAKVTPIQREQTKKTSAPSEDLGRTFTVPVDTPLGGKRLNPIGSSSQAQSAPTAVGTASRFSALRDTQELGYQQNFKSNSDPRSAIQSNTERVTMNILKANTITVQQTLNYRFSSLSGLCQLWRMEGLDKMLTTVISSRDPNLIVSALELINKRGNMWTLSLVTLVLPCLREILASSDSAGRPHLVQVATESLRLVMRSFADKIMDNCKQHNTVAAIGVDISREERHEKSKQALKDLIAIKNIADEKQKSVGGAQVFREISVIMQVLDK